MTVTVPQCDHHDPAQLAAWYGNFGWCEHYRKVTLAHCREIVRAEATLNGQKLSEARTDDLARLHKGYVDFLTANLAGRRAYEAMIRERMGV